MSADNFSSTPSSTTASGRTATADATAADGTGSDVGAVPGLDGLPLLHLPSLSIRPMQDADLDEVVQNEVAAYRHPWSRRIFADCLQAGYECHVIVAEEQLAAHGVLSVAIGECHLLTLCVHPRYQRRGLARRLFRFLLQRASEEDARICFLEVRQSNTPAIALYRSLGFVQVGERKNYYPQTHTEASGPDTPATPVSPASPTEVPIPASASSAPPAPSSPPNKKPPETRETALIMSCKLPLSY